jgi:hypothetical protein
VDEGVRPLDALLDHGGRRRGNRLGRRTALPNAAHKMTIPTNATGIDRVRTDLP